MWKKKRLENHLNSRITKNTIINKETFATIRAFAGRPATKQTKAHFFVLFDWIRFALAAARRHHRRGKRRCSHRAFVRLAFIRSLPRHLKSRRSLSAQRLCRHDEKNLRLLARYEVVFLLPLQSHSSPPRKFLQVGACLASSRRRTKQKRSQYQPPLRRKLLRTRVRGDRCNKRKRGKKNVACRPIFHLKNTRVCQAAEFSRTRDKA